MKKERNPGNKSKVQGNKQKNRQIVRGINGYTKRCANTLDSKSTKKLNDKHEHDRQNNKHDRHKRNKHSGEHIVKVINKQTGVNGNIIKRGSKARNFEQYKHFKGIYFDSSNSGSSNSIYPKSSPSKRGLSLYTKSKSFKSVYGEKVIEYRGEPYRFWEPKRSKICSAIHCGISQIGIIPGKRVLYLGASSGTTVSHVSDILGDKGLVFAVEFSDIPAKKLYFLAKERNNILPILSDAKTPKVYFPITGICDVVFQDISQKDQLEIFFRNCELILRKGGFGILSLKTRSIDVRLSPKTVFSKVKPILERKMTLVDYRSLEPFEEGHYIFVLKK